MNRTGPAPAVVDLVLHRDGKRCAWCGHPVWGERGTDWSLHHRRARGMGGDRRGDSNSPANLVLVHGHGTSGCHGAIESRRAEAMDRGFVLSKLWPLGPERSPIEHAVYGWCYLLADGSVATGSAVMSARDPGAMAYPQTYPSAPARCVCGHPAGAHFVDEDTKQRTNCSSWHGGRCTCKRYTPKEMHTDE